MKRGLGPALGSQTFDKVTPLNRCAMGVPAENWGTTVRAGSWFLVGASLAVAAKSFGHLPDWLALGLAFVGACVINHAYRDKRK